MDTQKSIVFCLLAAIVLSCCSAASLRSESAPAIEGVEGETIDSIVIENRDIYDTTLPQYSSFVFRLANKLHWKTHPGVIRRELLFKVGDPFRAELAEEAARNLRSSMALYDAWIETERMPNGKLLVRVVTIDQWSLSAGLDVSRTASETRWRFGPAERNLLGRNLFLDATYTFEGKEQDHLRLSYVDRRFYGSRHRVVLDYSDDPINAYKWASLSRPFYDLGQRFSWWLTGAKTKMRHDSYSDSTLLAQVMISSDLASVGGAHRFGNRSQQIVAGLQYDYVYQQVHDPVIVTLDPEEQQLARSRIPVDTSSHFVRAAATFHQMEFVKLNRIDGFGYIEDFTLGPSAGLELGRAWSRGGVLYDVVAAGGAHCAYFNSTLVALVVDGRYWFDSADVLRRKATLAGRIYNRALSFATFAGRWQFDYDRVDSSTEPLSLSGQMGGMRGYDKHFATGDRRAVAGLEVRLLTGLELLSAQFGAVVFADAGRTWKRDQPLSLDGFYASGGLGLRVSLERASKSAIIRIDLSYSERGGWQVTAGSMQYFPAWIGLSFLTSG
ncbi:MAG: hypothetical protein ABIE70_06410 [bacterium]